MSVSPLSVGLDYGTNSCRGIVVDTSNGALLATHVFNYPHGEKGILLDKKDHLCARQHPQDYADAFDTIMLELIAHLKKKKIALPRICGIGVDTTGSTPLPVDKNNTPLAYLPAFKNNLNAMAWLWKDHTSTHEALEITALGRKMRPAYLALCGTTYSSEWFWSKILRCAKIDPKVYAAAHSWVECCDWVTSYACGIINPHQIKRSICAAGHKALYHDSWGGYPDAEFLTMLSPQLSVLRKKLPQKAFASNECAGYLSDALRKKFGLHHTIPVAVGGFDAHCGAVGSGVGPGTIVKIIGTSTCDIGVSANTIGSLPGVCGVVPESVIPKMTGIEAGQSAVGDILNWFVEHVCKQDASYHATLTRAAQKLTPGQSGLMALDWNNGNRTVLVDAELTGLMIGQTLHTTQAELYRALIEATAFGAKKIIDRIKEHGIPVKKIIACGGISQKNALFMQIYADILGIPIEIAASEQTCALGSAIFGALVANVFTSAGNAQKSMVPKSVISYTPNKENTKTYAELYKIYTLLHDSFGTNQPKNSLFSCMKSLLSIKKKALT